MGTAAYIHGGSAVEDVVVKTTAEIPMADDGSICGDDARPAPPSLSLPDGLSVLL
jgi:hypothetical protein